MMTGTRPFLIDGRRCRHQPEIIARAFAESPPEELTGCVVVGPDAASGLAHWWRFNPGTQPCRG
jgi:hypothetical protein